MLPALQQNRLGILVSNGFLQKTDVEIYSLVKSREEKPTTKEIVSLLAMLVKDCGAKELEDWELMRLAKFIQSRYNELSVKEIKTAFEYAITGEYEDGFEVRHFGNFSAMYISRILNAFRLKARESLKIIRQALPEPEKVLSEDEIKVIQDNFLGTFDKVYSDFLIGKEVSHRVSWIYYEWLDTRKLITLTRKQKEKILFIARKKVNEERQQLQILIRLNRESGNPEDNVKSLAKAIAVIEQFKKYQDKGVKKISDLKGLR